MSESKTKQRYWITFLLDDLPEGKSFTPGLLHLTIIPWFVTDISEAEVLKSFKSYFSDAKKLDVKIGPTTSFGPHKDVTVSLIDPNPELLKIHSMALKWFEQIKARWAVKNPYVGHEFKPHIRRRSETELKENDILRLNSLSLVKANRQENNVRTVAAKVDLK